MCAADCSLAGCFIQKSLTRIPPLMTTFPILGCEAKNLANFSNHETKTFYDSIDVKIDRQCQHAERMSQDQHLSRTDLLDQTNSRPSQRATG
jgi:hypothetical protein